MQSAFAHGCATGLRSACLRGRLVGCCAGPHALALTQQHRALPEHEQPGFLIPSAPSCSTGQCSSASSRVRSASSDGCAWQGSALGRAAHLWNCEREDKAGPVCNQSCCSLVSLHTVNPLPGPPQTSRCASCLQLPSRARRAQSRCSRRALPPPPRPLRTRLRASGRLTPSTLQPVSV